MELLQKSWEVSYSEPRSRAVTESQFCSSAAGIGDLTNTLSCLSLVAPRAPAQERCYRPALTQAMCFHQVQLSKHKFWLFIHRCIVYMYIFRYNPYQQFSALMKRKRKHKHFLQKCFQHKFQGSPLCNIFLKCLEAELLLLQLFQLLLK